MKNLVQVIKPDKLNIVQVVNRTYIIQFKLWSHTCRIQFKQSGQTCRIRLKHSSQTCRIRIKHSRQTCRIMVKQLSQTCRFQLMQSIQTYRIQFKQSIQTCRIRVKQSIQTFRIQFPGGNFFPDSIPECPEHVVVIHYSTTLHHPLSLLHWSYTTLDCCMTKQEHESHTRQSYPRTHSSHCLSTQPVRCVSSLLIISHGAHDGFIVKRKLVM